MKTYFIFLFTCFTLFLACTVEDCDVNYADDIMILDSSLNTAIFYNKDSIENYLDNSGINHEFNSLKTDYELWCLHISPCDNNPTQTDSFWVIRKVFSKTLQSNSTDYQFKFSFYASLNEETPSKYADIFNLQVKIGEGHNCSVSTYVIDPRTDNTANNTNLTFQEQFQIGEKIYYNVFKDSNEGIEVIYNLENGLIHLNDVQNGIEFNLKD